MPTQAEVQTVNSTPRAPGRATGVPTPNPASVLSVSATVLAPPSALTLRSGLPSSPGPGYTSVLSSSQATPPCVRSTESARVTAPPSPGRTFLRRPPAMKAIHRPSGEKVGKPPFSVPGIGVGRSSPRRLSQIRPPVTVSTIASAEPSGESASGPLDVEATSSGPKATYRQVVPPPGARARQAQAA